LQTRITPLKYTFQPKLWMVIVTVLVMGLCVKAGLWQYNKAETKKALQAQLSKRLSEPAITLTDKLGGLNKDNLDSWRFKRVKFSGVYNTRYQVLLDNQVENTVAGYHILTPMQLDGSKEYVLVNRGWVAGTPDRKVPVVDTPTGSQIIEGDIILPSTRFFTLETPALKSEASQPIWPGGVWQNLDMQLYAKSVPFSVQPFVVRLGSKSKTGGGFKRNWPMPAERISMHLGYAYQWFGFALTLLVIFIVLNVKKNVYESGALKQYD
jgi:surfeit locus 1 family protein